MRAKKKLRCKAGVMSMRRIIVIISYKASKKFNSTLLTASSCMIKLFLYSCWIDFNLGKLTWRIRKNEKLLQHKKKVRIESGAKKLFYKIKWNITLIFKWDMMRFVLKAMIYGIESFFCYWLKTHLKRRGSFWHFNLIQ